MAKKPNIPELAVSRSEGEPGEPRAHHLIVIRGLSTEEYEKYVASRKRVMRFVNDYLKFTTTRRSYAEYISLLRAYDEEYSSERSETALKDQYEEEAPEVVQSFLDECSRIFDPADRFAERQGR